jgi:HK97 gp10 family phage protein
MIMANNVNIKGLDELLAKFNSVKHDTRYKGGRSALRKAANNVVAAAKQNARKIDDPRTSESILKNITTRWNGRRYKSTGDLGFRIGVLGGARGYAKASGEVKGKGAANPGGDTYYWRFLEFGTEKMAARPFLRKALMDHLQETTDVFADAYKNAIDKAIKKAGK